ncbi:glucans biosynthesis glucosyltransferase MdoH [Terrihabitans rhizophilus]|uniref:Glucans biosynthesis glucosyltransferase H n=1 Tax=Terrihabitans rhizophilus TaxID=3092662 RepID=A0ABU4RMB4_9HYPH|nr:glucans biosynthesis glucosyltransferase MdoH [Terrihabitans sp. PJ23]MDX6805721.1 glucans biosynthesis glucosyltransferase MdoH [Terrihabitans sp. PJ23]
MDEIVTAPAALQAQERFRALPDEAPLAMPVQSLFKKPPSGGRPASQPAFSFMRRAAIFLPTLAITAVGANEMFRVLNVAGMTIPEWFVLILFVLLFAWIAFSLCSSLPGFISLLFRNGWKLGIDPTRPLPELRQRTALLMPIYNEDPTRIMAGLQAVYEDLEASGRLDHFDFFILSDTTDAEVWIAEEAAFLALRQRTGGETRIFYRRRFKNVERKAGNISDWVRRFGAAYQQFIIFDADSVMTADAIVRLSAGIEENPDVGLIQTLPVIINGSTLFARLQQFAGRVYGPLIAHGIAWWHGSEGNYWGHNAVIRTRAFAEQAGLPHMKGRSPFGGHILSHDFIEAALMRRAGWAVHMVAGLQGSYEESPPSLTDVAARDRRWCQGNLQHMAVLPARGLHPVSRLHLLVGIGSYITAPLWFAFLLSGVLIALQARFVPPQYFGDEMSLFPSWPAQDPVRAAWVFGGTMAILLLPKFLAYIALLTRPEDRKGCGGAIRAFFSMILETLITGLIAPVMMLIQSVAVFDILIGRDAGWKPQRRDDGSIPFSDIVHRYAWHTAFGILTAWGAYEVAPSLFLWMTPVILGMVLAIPLAALTAWRSIGIGARRIGLFLIPEETSPPPVVARARAITKDLQVDETDTGAVQRLLADPELLGAHRSMLPARPRRRSGGVDAHLVVGLAKLEDVADEPMEVVLGDLEPRELGALLGDPRGLDQLLAIARR